MRKARLSSLRQVSGQCSSLWNAPRNAQCAALIEAYRRYHEGGNFAVLIYGAYENMLMEACPVNMALSDGQKQSCRLCKGNDHYLQDQKVSIIRCVVMRLYHASISQ